MLIGNISLDSDIIPDHKTRYTKEAFELFRHACTLHESAHLLELTTPHDNQKRSMIYMLAIKELTQKRDEIIERAILKYKEREKG